MLIFVLNVEREKARWKSMVKAFPTDSLIRVDGFDCTQWETSGTDDKGRRRFKDSVLREFVQDGVVKQTEYKLQPSELAVALGHKKIWNMIVERNIDKAIVLEDDVEPVSKRKKLENCFSMPENADVVFLGGTDFKMKFDYGIEKPVLTLDNRGRFIAGFGASRGYAITNTGAQRAIEAVTPLHTHFSQQWWINAFTDFGMTRPGCKKQENSGLAYGVKKGVVKSSASAEKSSMSVDGKKPWLYLEGL